MSATAEGAPVGSVEASPGGPVTVEELAELRPPPQVPLSKSIQILHFGRRQIEFVFKSRRILGEVFRVRGVVAGDPVISCHPDHARSLFTASPDLVPSITAESPLRPIVGPASVLTANGPRHLRQRKLLLPSFHGEAIERYGATIERVVEREIDGWPSSEVIAPRPADAGDHARRHPRRDPPPRPFRSRSSLTCSAPAAAGRSGQSAGAWPCSTAPSTP